VLPISHDEVVHGKRSLLGRMPGDEWQRFANARTFLAYMWTHPGKKLLFMGSEIGNPWEWSSDLSVPWNLLEYDVHKKLQTLVYDLNALYRNEPALHEVDFHYAGFEWIDFHDADHSIISFIRRPEAGDGFVVVCCNFTPVPREKYRIGVPDAGFYDEVLNTDSEAYGGSNMGNSGIVSSDPAPAHGRLQSIEITLPPQAVVVFRKR
jgi:1,4-alpha-glucan branching enzyme